MMVIVQDRLAVRCWLSVAGAGEYCSEILVTMHVLACVFSINFNVIGSD